MTEFNNSSKRNIADKDWLDIAFKHFLQHAQQRVQHFNYFIVFSSILTTATITTFQSNFQAHNLGVGLGVIQIFLSFIFSKLDDRNRFLIKHAENIVKNIEKDFENANGYCYSLFTSEEIETIKSKEKQKRTNYFSRQMSHKQSYNFIYTVFGLIGLTSILLSSLAMRNDKTSSPRNTKVIEFTVIRKPDSSVRITMDTINIKGFVEDVK